MEIYTNYFIVWLLCGIAGAAILSRSNKAGTGAILGFILGPIGIIVTLVIRSDSLRDEDKKTAIADRRECPFCAELILKKAKICKHCGKEVEPMAPAPAPVPFPTPSQTAQREANPEEKRYRVITIGVLGSIVVLVFFLVKFGS